nr:T9SS type A sorting domain-containing protein [uncultured Flavobacterium sp.]
MKKKLLLLALSLSYFNTVNAQTYCIPTSSTIEPITNVSFNTLNNIPNPGLDYVDNTNLNTTLLKDVTYNISVNGNTGGNYTNNITVFIDFNQNGSFEDAGERFEIGSISNNNGSGTPASNTITIPSDATSGTTRMRVRKNFFSSISTSCVNNTFGQTVDYSLIITNPENCTGAPASITVNPSLTSVCYGDVISLTHNVAYLNNYGYNWQASTNNGGTWATVSTSGTSILSFTITQNIQYRLQITCGTETATSNVISVNLKPMTECYCTNNIPLNCDDGDLITNVTFGAINNSTGCANTATGYSDYSNLATNLSQGQSYPISVDVGPSGDGWEYESVGVYIDFNQNGVFESNEAFYIGTGLNSTLTNNITIPQDAATGTTKMRVVVMASQATAFQENILEYSCGPLDISNNFGEMEDYTVNIQATASVNDNELNKIKVFPNPVASQLFIEGTATALIKNVEIYTISGQMVHKHNTTQVVENVELDINHLTAGVYLVKIQTDKGMITQKIIKK